MRSGLSIGDFSGTIRAATFSRIWFTRLPSGTKRSGSKSPAASPWPAITIFHAAWRSRTPWMFPWTSRKTFCSPGTPRSATTTSVNTGTVIRVVDKVTFQAQDRSAQNAAAPASVGGEPNIVGGDEDDTSAHMRNFFDCVRSRKEPNCPFELGYNSAIACQMAIASLRQGRTVEWDREKEDIV